MKHLKMFEDFDEKDLSNLLDRVKHLQHLVKTRTEFENRKEVKGPNFKDLSRDYKEYFNDFTDDDWSLYLYSTEFYSIIDMSKVYDSPFDAVTIFNQISPLLEGIKISFTQNGFNAHYQILFNGVAQCENNPKTHKNDIYVYKGYSHKDMMSDDISRYDENKLHIKIKFYFI